MLKNGSGQGGSLRARQAPQVRLSVESRRPGPVQGGATIAVLQTNSLPALVQRELERMILTGDLTAGAKLNEATIADRLGVSRGPVREAFRALEESGLVRLEKNRGVFVRQIAVEEADEIYELRAVLDEFAGRRVAESISAADLRGLRSLVKEMDRAVACEDVDAYHRANLAFHETLVALAGNGKLLLGRKRQQRTTMTHFKAPGLQVFTHLGHQAKQAQRVADRGT